jgi:hypothetical protein
MRYSPRFAELLDGGGSPTGHAAADKSPGSDPAGPGSSRGGAHHHCVEGQVAPQARFVTCITGYRETSAEPIAGGTP